jgi:hypothetical protein
MLHGFQADLGSISSEIRHLQVNVVKRINLLIQYHSETFTFQIIGRFTVNEYKIEE